jgi:hypothetical protein
MLLIRRSLKTITINMYFSNSKEKQQTTQEEFEELVDA